LLLKAVWVKHHKDLLWWLSCYILTNKRASQKNKL
jgi:hypothetical protein